MDPLLKDLINRLLVVKPKYRLGAKDQEHNMDKLKAHPFFKGIDFESDLTKLNVKELLFNTNLEEQFLTKVNKKPVKDIQINE